MDLLRSNIVSKLNEIFDEEKSKSIEHIIYENVINHCKNNNIPQYFKNNNFKRLYIAKSRHYYHNFKTNSYIMNKDIQKILNKKITLEKLLSYSSQQLYPSKWKVFAKDLEIMNSNVNDFDKEVTTTDIFKCPKCKQRKCCYSQYQIRSQDEPMTSFITCLNSDNGGCGHTWREG